MALMFDRIANNFAKNGYFPTDAVTMQRVINALDVPDTETYVIDPCCGEGAALADVTHHLRSSGTAIHSYGVEFDPQRAASARALLDVAVRSDVHDMSVKARSFGLLFLNPPYGDLVSDKAALSDATKGKQRLEKMFVERCHPWLATEGVLVLIVPYYALDAELSSRIASHYRDVRVFLAPEQRFKQCVIFGIKRKQAYLDNALCKQLEEIGQGQLPPELPELWTFAQYQTPTVLEVPHFKAINITTDGLAHELSRLSSSTLWPQFGRYFSATGAAHRRPLRKLTDWHLALALAAGQIQGVITSKDDRVLLIKGDTHKDRTMKVTHEQHGKNGQDVREVRTFTDKFVPSIKAIEFTPNSPMFGNLVTIQ
ncbi:MAG: DUF6094 domain-containing protein [Cytophagales bacterium]|nr:DUF6094 domain-containing protein [Cytophagales bacterium]